MVGLIEATGTTFGIALIILFRYLQTGQIPLIDFIKDSRLDKQAGNKAHNKINDNLEEIKDNTDETLEKVDSLQTAVLYLHSDEIAENSLLRSELDVENDHDLLSDD